jgi:hypothetical protein
MADEELYTALRNADAAGDTEAAKKIASYIQTRQTVKAAPKVDVPEEKPLDASALGMKVGLAEGALATATGMFAKPLSDIAGLAALGKELVSPGGGDPAAFKKDVQESLTYAPRTRAGELVTEYNPLALVGKAVSAVSGAAKSVVAPANTSGPIRSAIGNAVEESINQAPAVFGGKIAEGVQAAAKSLKGAARNMMQSALKPSAADQVSGNAAKAIDTLLENGVNVSRGGLDTLQGRISTINEKIASAIENSPATVNKQVVASRLQGALDKFEKQVTPTSDLATIQKAWDEFNNHPLLDKLTPAKTVPSAILDETGKPFTQDVPASGSNAIPVQLAQELKQGTYKSIGGKAYGELKGADIEAQKTLARGLKEEIAAAIPEVAPLNAAESKLLNALDITERRVLMSANKNPMGLSLLTTDPAKWAAFMADRSGLFKSLVARMLNQGSEAISVAAPVVEPASLAVGAEAPAQKKRQPLQAAR